MAIAPRLAAFWTRSTETLYAVPNPSEPSERDSPPIDPNPLLSMRTTVIRAPSWMDVAISDDIISHEPSPTITITSRSWPASFTPRPPATSYPMHE